MKARRVPGAKVRYAVVGAGWISQAAFMPAVAGSGNSELAALVTGDPEKARALGARYGLRHLLGYDDYPRLLASDEIDAIYLALPNGMHRDYAVPALEAGLHLLLEKPMAVSEEECREIEVAARRSGAELMIAYRLHFEPATLEAIRLVRAGRIGDPRLFTCVFSQPVAPTNHRARQGYWAGPVADMGPYPINAARHLFGAEPVEVTAMGARDPLLGFDFDASVAVTLRFPGDRLAQFTVSYGAASTGSYRIVGTDGDLEVAPGFTFGEPIHHRLKVGGRVHERAFPPTDQFAGELRYFSDCILHDRRPEPDAEEGLADVRIIAAIERALGHGGVERLEPFERARRPEPEQVQEVPPAKAPDLVNAAAPGTG